MYGSIDQMSKAIIIFPEAAFLISSPYLLLSAKGMQAKLLSVQNYNLYSNLNVFKIMYLEWING